jgi:predicted nuclease of restriction endonuclease-like (RecB) superfamily
MAKRKAPSPAALVPAADYDGLLGEVVVLLETARRTAARAVNAVMTATYWEIGRRIVEVEQRGGGRADYGEALLKRLSSDLTARFGRGFSDRSLYKMRLFYLCHCEISPALSAKSDTEISPTLSAKSVGRSVLIQQTPSVESGRGKAPTPSAESSPEKSQTPSGKLPAVSAKSEAISDAGLGTIGRLARRFPLPWSHYVRLLAVKDENARHFYEQEALRGGWSIRQLDRQVSSQFYERTLLSRNKAAMLRKGTEPQPGDLLTPEEEIKDPLVLEFLDLKDEYSEHDLEEALIRKLEDFLLELGGDFAFIGRQKRLRIGDEWYRIDLLFFHRRLRCLVVIDLKIGKFTHADSGQMHLYLNFAREHWMNEGENPPVGLILCAEKDEAVAHYALEGLPNKVMAAEYRLALPDERALAEELRSTQRTLELRRVIGHPARSPKAVTERRTRTPKGKKKG